MATTTPKNQQSESPTMNNYVMLDGTIEMGPFDSAETARQKALEEAANRVQTDDDAYFGMNFRIRPEWSCTHDPKNRWNIYRINEDHHYSIATYADDRWEVGVFDDDGRVIDDKVAMCEDIGEAVATLCWYLTQ